MSPEDERLLSAAETRERLHAPGVLGAVFSPHAVRCHPAKFVYALAELCESLGVLILEHSPVRSIEDGVCRTGGGRVAAEQVVLAVEGYSTRMPGLKRSLIPMMSSMIITEPFCEQQWDRMGWAGRECVSSAQHGFFYAQRTADDRIALGARGAPYRWGSQLDDNGRVGTRTVQQLQQITRELFPEVSFAFAHAWRGVLGVPRDWSPFIDADHRLIRMGGYVGQGVTAAYVAGRAVAELITDPAEGSTHPWIRRAPRNWEPEPLRWLGSRVVQGLYAAADADEARGERGRTSAFATAANLISGR